MPDDFETKRKAVSVKPSTDDIKRALDRLRLQAAIQKDADEHVIELDDPPNLPVKDVLRDGAQIPRTGSLAPAMPRVQTADIPENRGAFHVPEAHADGRPLADMAFRVPPEHWPSVPKMVGSSKPLSVDFKALLEKYGIKIPGK